MGDPQEAQDLLNSMSPAQLRERNKQESRLKNRVKKNYKPGRRK